MHRFTLQICYLMGFMTLLDCQEDTTTTEALAVIRAARSSILKDAFYGREDVAEGLWFESGGLETISNKIREARSSGRTFIVAFGGTSITAGHDNYFNQTYPEVFRRIASAAFSAAGIPLVVQNVAHGANPHLPYASCVRSFYGEADVISVEMKVMSKARATTRNKNSGPRSEHHNATWASPAAMTETLLRGALQLPSRPAVLFVDGVYGGPRQKKLVARMSAPPEDWPHGDSTVTLDHTSKTKAKSLLRHYQGFGLHRLDLGVATWFVDHFTSLNALLSANADGRHMSSGSGTDLHGDKPNPFSWMSLNGGKAFEHIGWHPGSSS